MRVEVSTVAGSGAAARDRSGVILFLGGRLALIERRRPGIGTYHVFPGGGVEDEESPADAAVREAWEELGVRVDVDPSPCLRVVGGRGTGWLFRADATSGSFGAGTGAEFTTAGRGTYRPVLLDLAEALQASLVPAVAAEAILRAWATDRWWDGLMSIEDRHGTVPERVRAGAVVLDGQSMLLIERHDGAERWYEIPGGGVDAGETPAEAVVRELREETGLTGTVLTKLADVERNRFQEHYFLVSATGTMADRATLDLEDDARPVWVPIADLATVPVWPKRLGWRIARWHRTGWPAEPVRLADSIQDLTAACTW